MKKFLSLFLCNIFLLQNFYLYSIDWSAELKKNFIDQKSLPFGHVERQNFTREDHELVVIDREFLVISIDELILNTDTGFLETQIDDFVLHVILGNSYILVSDKDPRSKHGFGGVAPFLYDMRYGSSPTPNYWDDFYIEGMRLSNAEKYIYHGDSRPVSAVDVSITNSTYLSENIRGKKFTYNGNSLHNYLYYNFFAAALQFHPLVYPWVEDVEGPGIGEWIQLDLSDERDTFYILNGFVDPFRPHLFKMNSRVKDATVIGTTNDGRTIKKEIHFLDFVYFKTIQFSEPVLSMRLIINSAYPGSRWQDTAISAIMLPSDPFFGRFDND